MCSRLLDDHGNHIEQGESKQFKGSIMFSSKNSFLGKSLSRRDDLISLCYVMIYIMEGNLPFSLQDYEELYQLEEFQKIGMLKNQLTPRQHCLSSKSRAILPFIEMVFDLGFTQLPDYQGLKTILEEALTSINIPLTNEYDWMQKKPVQETIQY